MSETEILAKPFTIEEFTNIWKKKLETLNPDDKGETLLLAREIARTSLEVQTLNEKIARARTETLRLFDLYKARVV